MAERSQLDVMRNLEICVHYGPVQRILLVLQSVQSELVDQQGYGLIHTSDPHITEKINKT